MSGKHRGKPGKSADSDITTKSLTIPANKFIPLSATVDIIKDFVLGKPYANPTYDLIPPFTPQFGFTKLASKSSPERKQRESKAYLSASVMDLTPVDKKREEPVVTPPLTIVKPEEYPSLPVAIKPQENTIWLKPDAKEFIKAPLPRKIKPVLPSKMQVILKPYEGEVETAVESINSYYSKPVQIYMEEEESNEVLIRMPRVYNIEEILAVKQLHASHQRTIAIDKAANRAQQAFILKVVKGKGKKNNQIWEEVPPDLIVRSGISQKQMMLKEKDEQQKVQEESKELLIRMPRVYDTKEILAVKQFQVSHQRTVEIDKAANRTLQVFRVKGKKSNVVLGEVAPDFRLEIAQEQTMLKEKAKVTSNLLPPSIQISKKKMLKEIRSICELFKAKILSKKILFACIFELLEVDGHFNEDKLEGAIILLKSGGRELEESSVVEKTERAMTILGILKSCVSTNLWIMITKLEDLRGNRWAKES